MAISWENQLLALRSEAVGKAQNQHTKVLCFDEPVTGEAIEDGRLRRGKVLGAPTDFVSISSSSSSSSSSSLRSFSTLSLTCLWCLRERILTWLSLSVGGAQASTRRAVVAGIPPALSLMLRELCKMSWCPVIMKITDCLDCSKVLDGSK